MDGETRCTALELIAKRHARQKIYDSSAWGTSLDAIVSRLPADADFVVETVEYHADASGDPRPFIVARLAY
ncbi:hypothetical protein B7H23_10500 [Notoacmeibacter marinus]|uniref:Uncharacterized protein n=1 Tax=Notoacmeibacter marinus TaxID=1876515 RepID=A0A231UXB4_9HYPH|nr:hypothetical protein B7H23_10500 [Notoacmeibacter marinus]